MISTVYLKEILEDEEMIRNRIVKNKISGVLITFISSLVVVPLVLILFYLLVNGISSINLDFIMNLPKPVGESGGGIFNAIAGSAIIVSVALVLSVPLAVSGGDLPV